MELSIILLTYNQNENALKIIDDIKNSNLDCEIIITDDCGSQNIFDIQPLHPDVKILRQDVNTRNQSKCRNDALKIANGKYVFFIDGDNTIFPNEIEKIICNLDKEYDIIFVRNIVETSCFIQETYCDKELFDSGNTREFLHSPSCAMFRTMYLLDNNLLYEETKYNWYSEDLYFMYIAIANTTNYLWSESNSIMTQNFNKTGNTVEKFENKDYLLYTMDICKSIKNIVSHRSDLLNLIDIYFKNEVERIRRYRIKEENII